MEWHYQVPTLLQNQYDPSDDEPDDCVCVLSVGPPFRYVIPSFDILAIDMWQMRIKGYTAEGEERNYDIFIPSLCQPYPVWMVIRDGTVIPMASDV